MVSEKNGMVGVERRPQRSPAIDALILRQHPGSWVAKTNWRMFVKARLARPFMVRLDPSQTDDQPASILGWFWGNSAGLVHRERHQGIHAAKRIGNRFGHGRIRQPPAIRHQQIFIGAGRQD